MVVAIVLSGPRMIQHEIVKLPDVTLYGHAVIHFTWALHALKGYEAKLALCRDVTAYIHRIESELRRRSA
jgi:hypothetical protein